MTPVVLGSVSSDAPPTETPTAALARVIQPLDPTRAAMLKESFSSMFDSIGAWQAEAVNLTVTGEDQTGKMKRARILRLEVRAARVALDKRRKELKANILVEGRSIDGAFNIFQSLSEPLEAHLLEQETFAERAEAARKDALRDARAETLKLLGADPATFADLGGASDESWALTVENARLAHESRLKAAREAEEARIEADRILEERREQERQAAVKVEAERQERERLAAEENAKLRAEAKKREVELEVERKRVAAERAKERAAAQAVVDAANEAQARADAVQRAAQREFDAARARADQEARDKANAEMAKRAAEAEAKELAAMAPDRDKLLTFAEAVRGVQVPKLASPLGIATQQKVEVQMAKAVAWIVKMGNDLSPQDNVEDEQPMATKGSLR